MATITALLCWSQGLQEADSQQDVMCLQHNAPVKCECLSLPDKATHPTNRQEDWEYIIGFCDQINKELEGYV